jgi:hypothetical protein
VGDHEESDPTRCRSRVTPLPHFFSYIHPAGHPSRQVGMLFMQHENSFAHRLVGC